MVSADTHLQRMADGQRPQAETQERPRRRNADRRRHHAVKHPVPGRSELLEPHDVARASERPGQDPPFGREPTAIVDEILPGSLPPAWISMLTKHTAHFGVHTWAARGG